MSKSFLLGLTALLLGSCHPAPTPQPDFLLSDELPFAETFEPTSRIDFGSRKAQAFLLQGFSAPEGQGAKSFRWSDGEESLIQFFSRGAETIEATWVVRAKASEEHPIQEAEIRLNQCELGSFEIPREVDRLRFTLPEDCLQEGRNALRWRWAWTETPKAGPGTKDRRNLAAAFFRLELDATTPESVETAGTDLIFPADSQVDFFLAVEKDSSLILGALEGPGELKLLLKREGSTDEAYGPWTAGDLPSLALGSSPQVQLSLASTGPPGTELRLIHPGLVSGKAPEGRAISPWPQFETPPNILIYLIDTLRADHLGTYGSPAGLTPEIDAFAAEAVLFERATAQSSWTKSSVASLFTGLLPPLHQANRREEILPKSLETIAEALSARGYESRAFGTNINISETFGFTRGFSEFTFMDDEVKGSEHLTRGALEWIDGRNSPQPFFLYLHTLDPHAPYQPREPFRSTFAAEVREETFDQSGPLIRTLEHGKHPVEETTIQELKRLYEGEIAANDASFGDLLQGLRERGLYENTVILLLSDHGEEFAENNQWTHGKNLLRETTQIPVILRIPGMNPGRSQVPVGHTDMKPLLLHLAGAPQKPEIDLESIQRPVFSYLHLDGPKKLAVTHEGFKYVSKIRHGLLGAGALYDLERDPQEEKNLASEHPVRTGYLRTLLRRHLIVPALGLKAESIEIEGEVRAELKALGYL